jgi:hypothetical protein
MTAMIKTRPGRVCTSILAEAVAARFRRHRRRAWESMDWQPDGEPRPALGTVLRRQRATEALYILARERQPQARALAGRLGGEDRLEETFQRAPGMGVVQEVKR